VSEKFGYKLVDDNVDGLSVWRVVQVGSGVMPGMIWRHFNWITWESEVVGRACGAPDRGSVRKNGSNE